MSAVRIYSSYVSNLQSTSEFETKSNTVSQRKIDMAIRRCFVFIVANTIKILVTKLEVL